MILNGFGNSAAPTAMAYAAGYPDLSNPYACLDDKGFHKNLHCRTLIGSTLMSRVNLLPDLAACNKPVVWHVMTGTPTIKPYVINQGPITADVLGYDSITYNLGGLEYLATKTDELDMACKPAGYEANVQAERSRVMEEKFDTDVLCTLPSFAHACNLGMDFLGQTIGTEDAPAKITNKVTNAPTNANYGLEYLSLGIERIRDRNIRGDVIAVVPIQVLRYLKKSEHFRNAQLNGKGSSYDAEHAQCDDMLTMACGFKVYGHNCAGIVGMTEGEVSRPIYQVIWWAPEYVDFKHGTVKRYKGERTPMTSAVVDWQVIRSGMAVSHGEAIAVGYVTLDI